MIFQGQSKSYGREGSAYKWGSFFDQIIKKHKTEQRAIILIVAKNYNEFGRFTKVECKSTRLLMSMNLLKSSITKEGCDCSNFLRQNL